MVTRIVLVIVGVYLCVVGAIVHRQTAYVHGVGWPWGLVLVLAATVAVVRAAVGFSRLGAAWLGLGWALALTGLQFSPGGSYLVASDWHGWVFTAGCLGVIVVAALRTPRVAR